MSGELTDSGRCRMLACVLSKEAFLFACSFTIGKERIDPGRHVGQRAE